MTRRLFLGALLTVLMLAAVVFALRPRPRGVTLADYQRLRPGMTSAEVEQWLHGPPRNDLEYRALVWLPHADGKRRSADIAPGPADLGFRVSEHFRSRSPKEVPPRNASDHWYFPGMATERGHQAVWITDAGLVAAYFGQDGRLQRTYFSTVDVTRPPTLIAWLASRPRMFRNSLGRQRAPVRWRSGAGSPGVWR